METGDKKIPWFSLIGSILVAGYFVFAAAHPETWHFIDSVNLIFHEAGHWIFLPFGEFMQILGGSLNQVLIPLIFVIYFFVKKQRISTGVVLFWLGQSIINVSIYAKDALSMQLPLLGGDGTIHDWNYLLMSLGWLRYTDAIGQTIFYLGVVAFFAGGAMVIWGLARPLDRQ